MARRRVKVEPVAKVARSENDALTRPLDITPARAKPFAEMGAPGTAVYGGFIVEGEKDQSLQGRQKYTTYSDILANTAIVGAGVRYFLNLVAKAGWRVEPANDSAEAKRLAELFEKILHEMNTPWHRVVRRLAMFKFYGFSICEWTAKRREDGAVGLKDIEPRPQLTIERWDVDPQGNVLGVIQRNPLDGRDIYLPREKLVYLCDDSLNDSPEGLGLFRHVAKAGRELERFELLEKWGFETDLRGIPVARAPLAKLQELVDNKKITPEQARALRAPLEQFIDKHAKNPALGMLIDSAVYRSEGEQRSPSGTPLWAVELMRGDGGPHEEVAAAIERKNREIARVLGVEQLLLGSDSKGSHALSQDKTQTFGVTVDSTLVELREQVKKDVRDPIWKLNGWPEELKPELKTESIQYRDIAQITAALKDLAGAGAPLAPNDPAVNEVRSQVGLSDAPEQDLSVDPNTGGVVAAPLGPDGEPLPKADIPIQDPAAEAATEEEEQEDGEEGSDGPFGKAQARQPAGTPVGGQFAGKTGGGYRSAEGAAALSARTSGKSRNLGDAKREFERQGGTVSVAGSVANFAANGKTLDMHLDAGGRMKRGSMGLSNATVRGNVRSVLEHFGMNTSIDVLKRAYVRHPSGTAVGGQFAPKGGSGGIGGGGDIGAGAAAGGFSPEQTQALRQLEGVFRGHNKAGSAGMGLLTAIRNNGASQSGIARLKAELVRLKAYTALYALDMLEPVKKAIKHRPPGPGGGQFMPDGGGGGGGLPEADKNGNIPSGAEMASDKEVDEVHDTLYGDATGDKATEAFNDLGDYEEIELSELKTIQSKVNRSSVQSIMDKGEFQGDADIRVLRHNGQLFLIDGNHRTTAAMASGEKKLGVTILDSSRLKGKVKKSDEEQVEKAGKQPRHPAGTNVGGQFAPKAGGAVSAGVVPEGGGAPGSAAQAEYDKLVAADGPEKALYFYGAKPQTTDADGVGQYINRGYEHTNQVLRGDKQPDGSKWANGRQADAAQITASLDREIGASIIGETTLHGASGGSLHRATRASHFGVALDNIKEGMTLQNHGFISTSKDAKIAKKWSKTSGEGAFVMSITTQRDSRGLDVNSYLAARNLKGQRFTLKEQEVILGRRSSFRVDRVERPKKGPVIVHVTHFNPPSFNEPFSHHD